jgi:anti-sigma-K factor RskA/putative zinc finger protein
MGLHDEFLELCSAATAGELSANEQSRLDSHLAACAECRQAMSEFEAATRLTVSALAQELATTGGVAGNSWSVEEAEKRLFKRIDREQKQSQPGKSEEGHAEGLMAGRRFAYRPSQIHWREVWTTLAAAVLLAVALGITAYKTGIKRGTDAARTIPVPAKENTPSLEAQVSDAGYARAQLEARLGENAKVIGDLKHQLSEQTKLVISLRSAGGASANPSGNGQENVRVASDDKTKRDEELAVAQAKLAEFQKTLEVATVQRDENARQAAGLEAQVNELTQLVRAREQALDEKEGEVAKRQELLEHDRDIRELMGARELYMADVHDVSGKGTAKTYGRVFYTKGKSLIVYAFDLDAQPGFQNAKSFQAWGRKGPDRAQARSLGIFYEDNASKKRWVLKADDPKTLEDIDAVFVTVEPHGGSQHPSGKQLLFASLRISPNHP